MYFKNPEPKSAVAPLLATVQTADGGTVVAVESVFEEADVDIDELIKNIKEVDFKYAEVNEARDPLLPLANVSQTILENGSARITRTAPEFDEIIYEANRKTLTGIMWDETQPLAVVDNEIVHVGFEFPEGIVVSSIERNHVVLSLELENENLEIIKELKEQ